jgi:methionyl-tRNA formyltransferase
VPAARTDAGRGTHKQTTPTTLRVAFAGTPGFALPALAALRERHDVVGVLTQPDRPRGRGRRIASGPVKQAALALGLPVAQPETLKTESARSLLRDWQPDVLVVVAFGVLLPPEILSIPPLGCINIHASLLPRWRGAAPIERALLAGDAETGVTIMQMDEGLDSGPMLLQRCLAIRPDQTAGMLHDELATLGAEALLETLDGLSAGALAPRPQPANGVTYAARITKAEALIDWKRDAATIERQVRAFNPRPIAETTLDGEALRIYAAHVVHSELVAQIIAGNGPLKDEKRRETGAIVGLSDESIIVGCGQGLLALTRVQRPGRRPVTAREYAQGSSLIGRRLG